jgi:hypothetical protein
LSNRDHRYGGIPVWKAVPKNEEKIVSPLNIMEEVRKKRLKEETERNKRILTQEFQDMLMDEQKGIEIYKKLREKAKEMNAINAVRLIDGILPEEEIQAEKIKVYLEGMRYGYNR